MLKWLGVLVRLALGAVWIFASAPKLDDPAANVRAVRAYQLLPESMEELVGHVQPILELVIGVCLVVGLLLPVMGLLSALAQVAFIFAISWVWAHGLSIDCGCFSGGGPRAGAQNSYPWDIARDVVLMLASLFLVWLRRTPLALDNILFRRTHDDPDLHDEENPREDHGQETA